MRIHSILLLILFFYSGLCFSQPIRPENYKRYSGACLSSKNFFYHGTYKFDIKACKTDGTIFCAFLTDFEVNRSEDYLKHLELAFELIGKRTDTIMCVAILSGGRSIIKNFPLGFDASEKFHQYTIVQESNAVKWLVDGKTIYELDAESSQLLLKPMRLFVNFRPAVSHCDQAWGCIRRAPLPTYVYVKRFEYTPATSTETNPDFPFSIFEKDISDDFKRLKAELWQFSSIDLIKGNKPIYLINNLQFERRGLRMTINRDKNHD